MFVPLASSAMLSLIDNENSIINEHRKMWASIAKESLNTGDYDKSANIKAIHKYFEFSTKRPIPPFYYYSLLLLAPYKEKSYIDDFTDKALVNYCIKEAEGIVYVYNNKPLDFVSITAQNRDSRDFWHWIRALSLISQFSSWSQYKEEYYKWIISQSNSEGLWEFPKKFNFALSDSWRGKNKIIDSSIFVLRFLNESKAF